MKTETENKRSEIYNNLSNFLDEKGFSFSEKMRVRRVVTMLAELGNARDIKYNYKYNYWEIKDKKELFSTENEARLCELLERMFYPEEVKNLYINDKIATIVRMLFKLFDYGDLESQFKK